MNGRETQQTENVDPFWDAVQSIELSPETLVLPHAANDPIVRRVIDWQYEKKPGEKNLKRQNSQLNDYLLRTYGVLSLDGCMVVIDYCHAQINDNFGMTHGEA